MTWLGKWRNQYGSVIEIISEKDDKITGRFRTALQDSGFYGQGIQVLGVCQGDCIGLSGGGSTPAGDMLVTYTGLLRDGKLETLWFVVADSALTLPKEDEPSQGTASKTRLHTQ
jgi:hypothetical protein